MIVLASFHKSRLFWKSTLKNIQSLTLENRISDLRNSCFRPWRSETRNTLIENCCSIGSNFIKKQAFSCDCYSYDVTKKVVTTWGHKKNSGRQQCANAYCKLSGICVNLYKCQFPNRSKNCCAKLLQINNFYFLEKIQSDSLKRCSLSHFLFLVLCQRHRRPSATFQFMRNLMTPKQKSTPSMTYTT